MRQEGYEQAIAEDREIRKVPVHRPGSGRRCERIGHIYKRSALGVYVCTKCGERLKDSA